MLMVVIGITYGALIGLFDNWLLFKRMKRNRQIGVDPLKGIGAIFLVRYLVDAVALLVFALVTRNAYGIVAAALSITVAVKISLFIIYVRKGGRID